MGTMGDTRDSPEVLGPVRVPNLNLSTMRASYEGKDPVTARLYQTIEALENLTKFDLVELRGMQKPPVLIKMTLECVCILKGLGPKRLKDFETGVFYTDYWETSKQVLNDPKLIDWIRSFDKDNVPLKTIKRLLPYVRNPEFTMVGRVSEAAGRLADWIIAVVAYYELIKGQVSMPLTPGSTPNATNVVNVTSPLSPGTPSASPSAGRHALSPSPPMGARFASPSRISAERAQGTFMLATESSFRREALVQEKKDKRWARHASPSRRSVEGRTLPSEASFRFQSPSRESSFRSLPPAEHPAKHSDLDDALLALSDLSKSDLYELRHLQQPPQLVRMVMEAVCILKGLGPKRVKDLDSGAYYTDYWETARALLQDYKLIEWIAHFEADTVPARVLRKLAPLVRTPEFEAENVARVCMAAGRLARWVTAVVDHNLEKHPHLVASSPTTPIASPSPSQQRGGSMLSRANSVPNKGVVPVLSQAARVPNSPVPRSPMQSIVIPEAGQLSAAVGASPFMLTGFQVALVHLARAVFMSMMGLSTLGLVYLQSQKEGGDMPFAVVLCYLSVAGGIMGMMMCNQQLFAHSQAVLMAQTKAE